ncbi:RNA polymerase sigma factor [Microbacterium sp.]|uniref:RNA polymerase sigma factor n=1 Tax=Microbacterium sp. TaxID=51671 RepID=UPI003A8C2445
MANADPAPIPREPGDADDTHDESSLWERAADSFQQWHDGDSRAMDALVRLLSPVLWHVVRAYGLDAASAEDVVQTTWLTLVRRHDSIADPRAVSGWLMTTARREAWRVAKLQRRAAPVESEDLEPHLPAAESAEGAATGHDRDSRLWRAVHTLDERCRRLLRVIAFEERPDYARLAADLSMPVGSIGPTRGRCLGKLRAALRGAGWNGEDNDL